jgi:hypothetical protein
MPAQLCPTAMLAGDHSPLSGRPSLPILIFDRGLPGKQLTQHLRVVRRVILDLPSLAVGGRLVVLEAISQILSYLVEVIGHVLA